MNSGEQTVTQVLASVERGEEGARQRLLEVVYEELRAMARAHMRAESPGLTLQPTALVHEAYLRLVGDQVAWKSRAQFFAAASLAMRRILVDRARRALAEKHGGGRERMELAGLEESTHPGGVDVLALDEALHRLAALDERLTEVVHLRFFAGLSVEQTAEVLGTSERTVKRDWNFARAWLRRELKPAEGETP